MYDEALKDSTIDNLGQKIISIAKTTETLAAQGYIINSRKRVKMDWSSIMLHAFENIDVLSKEQQTKVELIYNKLSAL